MMNGRTEIFRSDDASLRVARASRVLAMASRRRGLCRRKVRFGETPETNTRDACATRPLTALTHRPPKVKSL